MRGAIQRHPLQQPRTQGWAACFTDATISAPCGCPHISAPQQGVLVTCCVRLRDSRRTNQPCLWRFPPAALAIRHVSNSKHPPDTCRCKDRDSSPSRCGARVSSSWHGRRSTVRARKAIQRSERSASTPHRDCRTQIHDGVPVQRRSKGKFSNTACAGHTRWPSTQSRS